MQYSPFDPNIRGASQLYRTIALLGSLWYDRKSTTNEIIETADKFARYIHRGKA